MNQGMTENRGFEQVDADAVCEACGAVNDEGTLLCKQCGNNLRDQRTRRIAQGQSGDLVLEEKGNRIRLFTGLLATLGILLLIMTVLYLPTIEEWLVDSIQADAASVGDGDFWSGSDAGVYKMLAARLDERPYGRAEYRQALDNPILDSSYTGRYIVLRPGVLTANRVIAEAELEMRGRRIYFVIQALDGSAEIRGYAVLEEVNGNVSPVVRNTVTVRTAGGDSTANALGIARDEGGHSCIVYYGNDPAAEYLAFRLRS